MNETKEIYQGKYLQVHERIINGETYELAQLRAAVIIFAKDEQDRILFIREKRPHETPSSRLKPVTGFIDDGDDWLKTAQKELREEAGLVAQSYELIRHIPITGSITTDKYFVLAKGLTSDPNPIPNPDGDVIEECVYIDIEQAVKMTVTGEIPLVFDSIGLFLIKEQKL